MVASFDHIDETKKSRIEDLVEDGREEKFEKGRRKREERELPFVQPYKHSHSKRSSPS